MYNWIVAPHVTYLFAAQEYESAVSKAVEKNKVIAREVEAKTKKLEELYEQLARSRSALFTPDEAKEFFSDLQAVSEETGCTVHSLNLVVSEPSFGGKRKRSADTSSIVANSAMLTVSGQYNSIIRLVEKLQNGSTSSPSRAKSRDHTKRIWMDSFKIETIDSDSAQLKCDMTIIVYTISDKEAVL
jgi:hypothetical protein